MNIHIITHTRCHPLEAYFDKDQAYKRYSELRDEQDEYGVITLKIIDKPLDKQL